MALTCKVLHYRHTARRSHETESWCGGPINTVLRLFPAYTDFQNMQSVLFFILITGAGPAWQSAELISHTLVLKNTHHNKGWGVRARVALNPAASHTCMVLSIH